MMREIGYYWTKKNGHWYINYFHGELWAELREDTEMLVNDDEFEEIDELRIERDVKVSGNVEIKGSDLTT